MDEHWVKEDVYYAAVDFVFSCYGKLGEWPAVLDLPGGFVYCPQGTADYSGCFFLGGSGEHGNVVFRHDYLGAARIVEAFCVS